MVRNFGLIAASALSALSSVTMAQDPSMKLEDLVWLTASFPEAGQVSYIEMHEPDGKPMHL